MEAVSGEPWEWSAVETASAIRNGTVSAREVMVSIMERTHAVNPRVNAVVEILADEALAAANRADAARASGTPLGPLHGVPVTTKINVAQRGTATTNGVVAFRDLMASDDAPVIANLRLGGAIPFARTNVPAFSWRWFTNNDLHGRTINPHDPDRTPGGSSGGAAVAVATGIGAIAHGSDLAGSIRYPSAACGIYGLKPSFGRVPNFDPDAPERPILSQLLVTQGPMARNVGDLRSAFDVMRRADPRDPWHTSAETPVRNDVRRVGRISPPPGFADREVVDALDHVETLLTKAGYEIEPLNVDFDEIYELHLGVLGEARHGLLDRIKQFGDDAIRASADAMFAHAPALDLASYMKVLSNRSNAIRGWRSKLARTPIILAPVSWWIPFANDLDLQGEQVVGDMLKAMLPTIAANILGLPALAMPATRAGRIPVGVQLIADRFREHDLMDVAEELSVHQSPVSIVDGSRES